MCSVHDAVDSEFIANALEIDKHSKTHDFDNHVKLAVRECLDPSSSLAELVDKIETDKQFDRNYTRYHRFCELKHSDDDFVTLLRSDAQIDVL